MAGEKKQKRSCGCLVFEIIAIIVLIIALAALIFWLIFRPINTLNFHVTNASLTQFKLASDNSLHYNLALSIATRNPNKKIGVFYDSIEANAYFLNRRFATQTLAPFYQGFKSSVYLTPAFEGQHLMLFGADDVYEYNAEKNSGVYSIDVKLSLRMRFKLGEFKTSKFKQRIVCRLKVPLSSSHGKLGIETTKCKVDRIFL